MNITIVGGGNVGTQFAVHCAAKGHTVIVFTPQYACFKKELFIIDENDSVLLKGKISCATDDPKLAFNNADLIFIIVPAFCVDSVVDLIIKNAVKKPPIGLIPGTGGMECAFAQYQGAIFGIQRIPAMARLKIAGSRVCAVGYRKELHLSTFNEDQADQFCKIMENLFDIKCHYIPGYLNVTLTPSNPILHTTRLYTLFKNYQIGTIYDTVPLFYEDWTDEASELLFLCDSELQQICKAYSNLGLEYVKSLKQHYEVNTPKELTQKMKSINGFKGIKTPMIAIEGGFIPDFNSRYFLSDFPYGLSIIRQIASFSDVKTPNIDKILNWYRTCQPNVKEFSYEKYGIKNKDELIAFYSR